MKNFLKGKLVTGIIILATFVLAGIAIFTAIRLYQLRQQPVAPNVPSSIPNASETKPAANAKCTQTFSLTLSTASPTASPTETPTGSPTSSPTSSPTASPTPTGSSTPGPTATPNSCNGTCGSNFNCASDLVCYNGYCRNPSCTSETDCTCAGSSTSSPAPTGTPPSLPQSGTDWPTLASAAVGIIVIIGSLVLAF